VTFYTRDEGEKCDKNCQLRGISSSLSHLSQLFLFLSCAPLKFGHIFCDSCSQSVDEEREWRATRAILADMGLSASQSAACLSLHSPPFLLFLSLVGAHAKSGVLCGDGGGGKIGPNLKLLSPLCSASLLFLDLSRQICYPRTAHGH
jgi:hypothetical protein